MSAHSVTCWSCGHSWEFSPPLGRGELCIKCRRDAKACLNCKFHDRHAARECLESQAEIVKDKEKSNFCDWFDPKASDGISGSLNTGNPLDSLFGSPSASPSNLQSNVQSNVQANANSSIKSKLEEEFAAFLGKK